MQKDFENKKVSGVGFNLRPELLDEFLKESPDCDFVEVIADNWLSPGPHHEKLLKIRENYPISFHCVGMNLGGIDPINIDYLKRIKALIEKFIPFQVSDHLAFQAHDGSYHHDLLPFPFTTEYLDNSIKRIQLVQEFLNRQILVENLSYYLEFKINRIEEFDFINNVLNKADCFLLLDLNNIWVNEQNFNSDSKSILKRLDWNRVKEVHLAGAEKKGDAFIDTHGSPIHSTQFDWINEYRNELSKLPLVYEKDNNVEGLNDYLCEIKKIREHLHG